MNTVRTHQTETLSFTGMFIHYTPIDFEPYYAAIPNMAYTTAVKFFNTKNCSKT